MRTTLVISLIISHLVCILFFSLSIANHQLFKELVLVLIAYLMVILFLISSGDVKIKEILSYREIAYKTAALKAFSLVILFTTIFITIFFISKNIEQFGQKILDEKNIIQAEIANNQMISNSHPLHEAAKESFLLDRKSNSDFSFEAKLTKNEKKLARLKDNLLDNFLLKRSSDMIVIVVGISAILLILSQKKLIKT